MSSRIGGWDGTLWSVVPEVSSVVMRRTVFSLCGWLVSHLPVCGWLCVAYEIVKWRASSVTKGWDNEARDTVLQHMMFETIESVQQDDPACGDWCVDSKEMNIWVNASSVAIGVALEWRERVLEDACWLRPEDNAQHINLAELDVKLKGINLALQWQGKVLHVKTDSVCVYPWVLNTLIGKACVRTKAASVIHQLEAVFFKCGPLHKILTDNDTAFCSKGFQAFAHEWRIHLWFRCAYAPTRNGIVKRCHSTVKQIAARIWCPIQEAVYWYNITPSDDVSPSTVSANRIYQYEVRVKGANHATASPGPKHSSYQVGERVWVKAPQSQCTTKLGRSEVTKIIDPQTILVEGIPHHIKDLHPRHCVITPEDDSNSTMSSERRAESLLQDDGEDSKPDSAPTEEAEAAPLPAFTKKYQTKAPAARLSSLYHDIRGESTERNHAHNSSKHARICLVCKMRSGREIRVIVEIKLTSSPSWIMFDVRTTYMVTRM